MNRLHDSVDIEDMMYRLKDLGIENPNYAPMVKRLTGYAPTEITNFDKLNNNSFKLMSSFWRTMKKQNADAITVFILSNGETIVSDTTLNSTAKQAKKELSNDMISAFKNDKSPFISYKNGVFNPTPAVSSYKLDSSNPKTYIGFLANLGIKFTEQELSKEKLTDNQLKAFMKAVDGIRKSISEVENLSAVSTYTLDIDGNMLALATIKAVIEHPDFDSTYYNISGERTQTFIGPNALSDLYHVMLSVNNIQDLQNTNYAFLLTDAFSEGNSSALLSKMFNIGPGGDGSRIYGSEKLLKPSYVDGTINEGKNKKKQSSKLTYKERIIQEMNLNINGVFHNLIPGDATIEWAVNMYNKDAPFVNTAIYKTGEYREFFKRYFISEVNLSRANRPIVGSKKRSNKDLRFFKAILADNNADEDKVNALHDKIIKASEKNITPEGLYNDFQGEINKALDKFIERETKDTLDMLYDNSIVTTTEKGLELEGINFNDRGEVLTEESLKDNVRLISINYIMANIELHKLIYSDPYQYSDELKRIKNFNSPRQPMMVGNSDSSKNKIDRVLDEISNKLYKAQNDIARADMFRNYFNAVTLDDVISAEDLEGYNVIEDQNIDNSWEETDGGGYIMLKAIRTFRKRVGTWNDSNERQYVYDMVYEKIIKGDGKNEEERAKLGLTISKEEKEIYLAGNPMVKSTYTPEKPIVSGSKLSERGYNDIVLDKYALNVLSFRLLHEMNPSSNAVKLYNKMQKEDIDYAVYNTGRKVGTEITHPIYDENGKFNNTPFTTKEQLNNKMLPQGIVKIPFNIMSVQSEVPSKDTPQVTQGSQITKLATLDFLEAGVPIDFEYKVDGVIVEDFDDRYVAWIKMSDEERKTKSGLYKEIINNNEILAARIELGYETLLTKLGIEKTDLGFVMKKPDVLVKTLTDEILSREVNENIISAFNGYKKGEVILEATPAYKQIRNILYALADKNVISPKISGGMKVQIPATMLESNQIVKHKYVAKGETKVIYKSGKLKFYENADGKRVCEIMVARWFKSDKTDEELLESWYDKDGNITDEVKKVLSGIGFRIPTQKQNSIDAFVIKKFLPYELGDSVVIPSALVKKAGSDFDIDKLSIYLKNVFTDNKGQPQAVPYYGIGKDAKAKFAEMFDKGELLNKSQLKELDKEIALYNSGEYEGRLIEAIFGTLGSFTTQELVEDFVEGINKDGLKETIVNGMYKKSLENAYITSLENLVSHPANFDNLIKPNSADQLKSLSKKIYGKLGNKQTDYGSTSNMLSRRFMSGLRQAFVNGKYAIGIAAIAQTNHSQNQRSPIYIDTDRLGTEAISAIDRAWLGDGELKFAKYNSMFINGKDRATFSKVKNAKGEYISDIIGQFIDGYVDISKGPWIMEMGATPNIASTWLLLIKLGVPINDVAYFMNQPIIRDYIKEIQSNGYSYLFIDKYSTAINEKYNPGKGYSTTSTPISSIPNESTLLESIGKDVSKMDKTEKAAQQFMLREFLKYAKMSEHLLHVTQGSNYDTAALNDPFLIFKKEMMLIKARNTIISSVDNLLDNSHVGVIRKTVGNIRDAYATVLLSDRDRNESGGATVRSVLQNVLMPYIDMPDKTFLKISQKAVSDLFDWAVQNNEGFNEQIKSVLLGSSTAPSAATSVMSFVNSIKMDKDHQLYNNMIIESLRKDSGPIINDIDPTTGQLRYGKPDNLYIVSKDNKAYDQDRIINSFREVREYLKGIGRYDIYEKMVAVTVIQSGLSNSILSYTQLLPYEDFKKVYNETLFNLDKLTNLANFYNLDVFQRNNWSNPDIVVGERARLLKSQAGNWYNPNEVFLDKSLKNAYEKDRTLPKMLSFSTQSVAGRSDFVSYTWEDYVGKTKKSILRKKGDRSYIKKGLFKKVYYTNPVTNNFEPLIQVQNYKGKIYNNYVYVAINAWGDSFRANEFYDTAQPSVINNEYIKVVDTFDKANKRLTKGEVTGEEVANVYFKINTHVAIEPIDPLTANFVKEQDNSKTTPPGLPGIDRSPTKCE
jgi:rRNA processing protein Gar1/arsenate reductase-like glutaredoxin family protein